MNAVLIIMGAFIVALSVVVGVVFAQCKMGSEEGICQYDYED